MGICLTAIHIALFSQEGGIATTARTGYPSQLKSAIAAVREAREERPSRPSTAISLRELDKRRRALTPRNAQVKHLEQLAALGRATVERQAKTGRRAAANAWANASEEEEELRYRLGLVHLLRISPRNHGW